MKNRSVERVYKTVDCLNRKVFQENENGLFQQIYQKSRYTARYIVYLSSWKANILSVMVCYHRHLRNTDFSLKMISAFAIDISKESIYSWIHCLLKQLESQYFVGYGMLPPTSKKQRQFTEDRISFFNRYIQRVDTTQLGTLFTQAAGKSIFCQLWYVTTDI